MYVGDYCLSYHHNLSYELNTTTPRLSECDLFITVPVIIAGFLAIFSLPHLIVLLLKKSNRRRGLSLLFITKIFSYAMLMAILIWKFVNLIKSDRPYTWNYLYPSALALLIVLQVLIMNLERIRDRTSSATYFLGCLLLAIVSGVAAWTTASYRLRPPEWPLYGVVKPVSGNWNLEVTPHELTDYLLCGAAVFNLFLAFFCDRSQPPAPKVTHDRIIQPSLRPPDFDLLAGDEKPAPDLVDTDEPNTEICPEKYVSYPSRVTYFWVTRLIILGYRKTLSMGHLWLLEQKYLSASLVPQFLRNLQKYMHVDISQDLDTPHPQTSGISVGWTAPQENASSDSEEPKPQGGGTPEGGASPAGRRSTFNDIGGLADPKSAPKRQRTMSGAPDIGKKSATAGSSSILSNVQIRISGRHSKPKITAGKKGSAVGDIEASLLGADSKSSGKSGDKTPGKPVASSATPKPRGSLVKVLLATFGGRMCFSGLFKLCHDVCLLSGPVLLKRLLGFLKGMDREPTWCGYAYACAMFVIAFIQSISLHQYFRIQTIVGMDIRTVIISAVYRKSLRLSAAAHGESTTGEITNLMSIDAQRFYMLMLNIHVLWSAPFQISLALYLLWKELGPSVLAGVCILVVMIPINIIIARKSKSLQEKQLKTTDKRIKLISEILNGIRVLKLYAWEPSFINEVGAIRKRELRYLRKFMYLDCVTSFVFSCAPTMVALTSFGTFILTSATNIFTADKAFVSLALLNILRFPLFMFPTLLSNLVQTMVSVRRVSKFLMNTELDPGAVSHEDTPGVAAVMENATLAWAPDAEPSLQNLTIYFSEGKSTAIVGRVGCGKTSLLNALLGNMDLVSGRINVKGRTALVAQQAWIFNATLRDNILFHRPYDAERYARVIEACALGPDIKLLPDGDLTDIGDKGVNLSGGQKQRISIARACYAEADVYLFDDPLAAVDAHVAAHLLERVLGPHGLLAGRTRIIATHHPSAIAAADRVAVLAAGGRLAEYGAYAALHSRPTSALNAFLRSEELRQRLLSEESETAASEVAASASVAAESELRKRRRRQTSSESRLTSVVLPVDLSELAPMEPELAEAKDDEKSSDTEASSDEYDDTDREKDEKMAVTVASPESHDNKADGERSEESPKQSVNRAETAATGRVKLAVFWLYIRSVGLFLFAGGMVFILLTQFSWLGHNIWLADWTSDEKKLKTIEMNASDATRLEDVPTAAVRLGVYAAIGFLQVLFSVLAYLLLAVGSVRASKSLHYGLLSCILHVPTSFFDIVPQGRIMNRFSNDVSTVDSHLMVSIRSMVITLVGCLITFGLCVYPSPYLIILIGILLIFYGIMQNLFVTTSRQLKRLDSVSKSPIFSHFAETLLGVDTIRAYGLGDLFVATNDDRVDTNNRALFATLICNRWLSMVLETVGNLLTFAVSVSFVATWEESQSTLAAGFAGMVISYTLNITQGLSWFVRMATEVETNVVSVERIGEYSQLPIEAPWEVKSEKPPASWPEGGIEFENYSTRYREDLDPVLRSVSFSIKPGEKIGIVGRTGSGKSSLVLALFRIIEPIEGEIRIDGVNISRIGLHDLRGRITLIPQDPVLFSGTLRFNLDPFNSYSDEAVWTALEMANLRAFVQDASAEGLNLPIAEGGNNLSQGQRQLVCLARALLRRSRILVLDEATAAVDPQTDQLIQRTVRSEFAASTVLTIAHRLNTILDYDRIMVLDAGRLAEMDSPKALAEKSGSIFRGMLQESNLLDSLLDS